MKRQLIITSLLLSLCAFAHIAGAATTDTVLDNEVTVSNVIGDGITANLVVIGGSAESITFNSSGALVITNPDSSAVIRLRTDDTGVLSIHVLNSSGASSICKDNTAIDFNDVRLPTAADSYTITPSSTHCDGGTTTSSGTSSSGGSSGGGSSSYRSPAVITTVPVVTTPTTVTTPVVGTKVSAGMKFNRSFTVGSAGADVKSLQKFLNSNGFIIATTGVGSVGKETTTFGGLTKVALIKFQIANGVITKATDQGAGVVGPKTRVAILKY